MVKYLVIRFSSIGDIVLTTPVVRHLKQQVEGAEVHYLTKKTYASLLEANPYIDRVHAYDGNIRSCIRILKEESFDYIIDLHHNTRTAQIKVGLKRMDFSVKKLNALKWLYVNLGSSKAFACGTCSRAAFHSANLPLSSALLREAKRR